MDVLSILCCEEKDSRVGLMKIIKVLAVGAGVFLLAGCEQEKPEVGGPIVWAVPSLYEQSATLELLSARLVPPEAAADPFHALSVIRKEEQTGEGSFVRYTVDSSAGMMQVEGELYSMLVKRGYSRRMLRQSAGLFAVEYVNPADVALMAEFSETPEGNAAAGTGSRLLLSWKVSD